MSFERWFSNAVRDVNHELGVFFNQTIPKVGNDIKTSVSTVWHDTTGIVKDVVHLPTQVLSGGKDVIQQVGTSGSQIIQTTGTAAKDLGQGVLFSSPAIIGIGLIGAYLVLSRR